MLSEVLFGIVIAIAFMVVFACLNNLERKMEMQRRAFRKLFCELKALIDEQPKK